MFYRQSEKPSEQTPESFKGGNLAQEEDVTNEMRLIGCKMVQEACKRKSHDPNSEGNVETGTVLR